jgi:hypothetical protein
MAWLPDGASGSFFKSDWEGADCLIWPEPTGNFVESERKSRRGIGEDSVKPGCELREEQKLFIFVKRFRVGAARL